MFKDNTIKHAQWEVTREYDSQIDDSGVVKSLSLYSSQTYLQTAHLAGSVAEGEVWEREVMTGHQVALPELPDWRYVNHQRFTTNASMSHILSTKILLSTQFHCPANLQYDPFLLLLL